MEILGCVPLGWSRWGSVIQDPRHSGCIPLGSSGSRSVIWDHWDHAAPNNPVRWILSPEWIHRFISCNMIRVISGCWSWSRASQRNAPSDHSKSKKSTNHRTGSSSIIPKDLKGTQPFAYKTVSKMSEWFIYYSARLYYIIKLSRN